VKVKIAIFDDHEDSIAAIETLLKSEGSFDVVGRFYNTNACVQKVLTCDADVVLIDIASSGRMGIAAIKELRSKLPYLKIVVQTALEDGECVFKCIKAGAVGYVLKKNAKQWLISTIKDLQHDGAPMAPIIARKLFNFIYRKCDERRSVKINRDYQLTLREKTILNYLVNGLSYKMIGHELGISYETIRSHMKKVYRKLEVSSLTEVVAKAIKQEIV